MMSSVNSIVILCLLSIISTGCTRNVPNYTQVINFGREVHPLHLKDETLFTYWINDDTIVTSTEPGYKECNITKSIPASRWRLGNGKIVAVTLIVTFFEILDYKDCESHSAVSIDDGKPYKYDYDKELHLVVPYYDTFDMFDSKLKTCTPCRYNDKGERLQVNNTLSVGKDERDWDMVPFKNGFGMDKGYIFVVKFDNRTSLLKILDSNFKAVRTEPFNIQIEGYSFNNGNLTVCGLTHGPQGRWGFIAWKGIECRIYDSNMTAITTSKMRWPSDSNPSDTTISITNLKTGGAMVSIKLTDWNIGRENTHNIYIQQINPDGTVERATQFGHFSSGFVGIDDFMTKNGEYCLYARDSDKKNAVVKCVAPKTTKKD